MRLLSNPGGGALAVIGHVERAWTHSFSQGKLKSQTQAYQSLLFQLMEGKPIGMAMDDMNLRYATIASTLAFNLGELKFNKNFISQFELSLQWASTNDARGYAVLGDPAVRVAVGAAGTVSDTRPVISLAGKFIGGLPVVFSPEALVTLSTTEQQQALTETQALQKVHGAFSVPVAAEELTDTILPVPVESGEELIVTPAPSLEPITHDFLEPGGQLPDNGALDLDQPGETPPRQVILEPLVIPPAAQNSGRSYMTAVDALAMALQEYDSNRAEAFSFNLLDDAREKVKEIVVGLNSALANLATSMEKMTSEAATLTITTGVVEDLKQLDPAAVEPRFVTSISLGGDVKVFVPRQADEMDETLLALHKEMVNQAMANRLAFMKAVGETVTTLFAGPKS